MSKNVKKNINFLYWASFGVWQNNALKAILIYSVLRFFNFIGASILNIASIYTMSPKEKHLEMLIDVFRHFDSKHKPGSVRENHEVLI